MEECNWRYKINHLKQEEEADALQIPVPCSREDITYLQFPGLESTGIVKHLFSTRLGGVSENEFSSMNLSFTRGDREEAVAENYRRIARVLDCRPEDMVATYQTHTRNVRLITSKDKGLGVTRPKTFQDVDGLITNEKGIVLLAYFADCVPLYFVDPVNMAIGLAHSGWKGTKLGIGEEILLQMHKEFGTNPEDVHCAIGPSICRDCYEVSEDLVQEFQTDFWERYGEDKVAFMMDASEEYSANLPALFLKKKNEKYQLDLWLANRLVLQKAGIREEHLEVTSLCTCCNPDLLFSHRATKGKRGNLCAFLGLRD